VFTAYEAIKKVPWMSVLKPTGTFYLFINIQKSHKTSEEISRILLEKAQVLTIPGNAFGHSGEGYVRIACTVDSDTPIEAFDRISKIEI
jgi:aspartate/methionine/tyrosine aminotransferase